VAELRVALEQIEEPVHEAHEPVPELLAGAIPLAVPVRVGNDDEVAGRGQRASPSASF
jgi:hypothetical protein